MSEGPMSEGQVEATQEESKLKGASLAWGEAQGWFHSFFRVGIIYFIGFSLFFLSAFLVIKVRISTAAPVEVPSLVGKSFIAEYNRLASLGFAVEVKEASLAEYPYGYVLSQSLQPGSMSKSGASLVLLVNGSRALVPVPKLVGSQERLAQTVLQNIPVGVAIYTLHVGTITYIPSERPPGEILAQDPPEGAIVAPESPVALLVSSRTAKRKKISQAAPTQGENFTIQLLKSWSYLERVPLSIETVETKNPFEDGLVVSVREEQVVAKSSGEHSGLVWKAKVKRYPIEEKEEFYPNRIVWLEGERRVEGMRYTVAVENPEKPGKYDEAAYLIMGKDFPIFLRSKAELKFWPGYVEINVGEALSGHAEGEGHGGKGGLTKKKIPTPEFKAEVESISI